MGKQATGTRDDEATKHRAEVSKTDLDVFHAFVRAGQRLAKIHVHYEQQPEYPLTKKEKEGEKLDYRVEKMRLSKDKTTLTYNQFLTLTGIPKETYEYRLGNRSALEWIIDQYQVSTESGLNRQAQWHHQQSQSCRRPDLHPPPYRPSPHR